MTRTQPQNDEAVLDAATSAQDTHEATRRPRGNPKTEEAAQAATTAHVAIHIG
ncbi:hypothetical protein [Nocardia amikacinitolerans]|uniref:hypothetical protein n=1 Tax=Nocardia amikacinitolerans TaxID=756689 RepID=UPI0015C6E532|nr:hypothetical protein [Nocardia amikacinitolerans]